MSEPDLLFTVRNSFFLGAFQGAIAEASDLEGLSDAAKVERDSFVYRAYIELGSYEVMQFICRQSGSRNTKHSVLPWNCAPLMLCNTATGLRTDRGVCLPACNQGSRQSLSPDTAGCQATGSVSRQKA